MANNIGNLTGKTLGTCVLERLIGQGGMGAVYLAQQTRPSRHVAVKVLLPNLAMHSEVYQEFLARFRREADVIARLEHVNIMPIYEYGEQDGLAYLVMPHMTGGSLRDILSKRGALPLPEVASYIDQAASALDYAHAQGVIHRDLKPANFLLHADGRLVLADFGIARIMEESNAAGATLTGTGTLLGTPEYMAPEMARGEQVDYRADIYELGVVLYQMISGRVPFSGGTPYAVVAKHVQDPLPLLHQVMALPPAVDAVIQKATAKQREDRYTTTRAMAQDLRNAISGANTFQRSDDGFLPTVASSNRPVVLPPPPQPQYHTPMQSQPTQSQQPSQPGFQQGQYPNTYLPSAAPHTPPYMTQPPPTRRQPALVVLGILLAAILIIGGVIIGVQLSKNASSNHPTGAATATSSSQSTQSTTKPTQPAATNAANTTPTQATANPTSAPATPTTGGAAVPIGKQLYTTNLPGQNCDPNGGGWSDYNGVKIDCLGNKVRVSNTAQSATLQGTFLATLPGQAYPADYVVQVQLRQDVNSNNDFGLYFRNQPGQQQGAYTFLIHPDGTWNAYVYDNNTGAATQLSGGYAGNAHALLTLAVVAKGQQFSFYVNGKLLGSVNDAHYTNGTAGIAVDQGTHVTVGSFTLSSTQ
jgi:serine/threonine protein kinase